MRRLMGQDMLDQPLLPQPGDIWADVLPRAEPAPATTLPATSRREHRSVVAAAPGARSTQPAGPPQPVGPPHQANPAGPETAKAAPPVEPNPARHPAMPHLAVQLAAVRSAQLAEAEWRRLRQHAPRLTDGHQPAVIEAEVNGHQVWRLRTAGFAGVAEASAFCSDIRAVKSDCWVVPPSASP